MRIYLAYDTLFENALIFLSVMFNGTAYLPTGCPRKQFTLFDNALILKLFIAQVRYYTHFEADIASFKMSTHTLHRCH